MKIIDLLNKIANNEEVPKHINIRCLDRYTWQEDVKAYWSDIDENNLLYDLDLSSNELNEEIEIIEEENKIPEKLEDYDFDDGLDANTKCECLRERMQEIENQLDEIIDYLKSKGE